MLAKNRSGFTLIELLMVISIISFIATSILTTVGNSTKKARDTKRKGDLKQVYNALNLYSFGAGNGLYPNTDGSWECFANSNALQDGLKNSQIMVSIPNDPKGKNGLSTGNYCYSYKSNGGNEFKIRAEMELDMTIMANDGGNNSGLYELFSRGGQTY
jgi:prepilin-type N-terminal cleavage/methylation domain-containing protein